MKVHRGFDLDSSCKLWLPFYQYGGEQPKIYDQSGNNNHGTITGTVPASIPILSGIELVTNGTFTGNANGWTLGAAWAYNANVVDKNADGTNTLSQTLSISANKRYKISYWLSNWTVGTVTPTLGGVAGSASSAANGYYETFIVTTDATDLIFTPTNTARFTIDTISVQEVISYQGIGWSFDGVNKKVVVPDTANLRIADNLTILIWINPNAVNSNANFIGKVSLTTKANFVVYQSPTILNWLATLSVAGWNTIAYQEPSNISDKWNFIGMTFAGGLGYSYCNGVQSTVQNNAGQTLYNNSDSGDLFIGGVFSQYYKGYIGEIRIHDRAFSAAEYRNYYETTRHIFGV